ncbi:beta-lactamase class A [Herbihabitans rhizosphaerae]|uniref:Beta-lactamase n=1 Tax=Herbihabitans rhizosphaerae TaxID=1872711 RepID=A0A4Q7L6P5_9PSEU|nr:class A beta-lactamase [Herbihabitans rhizosphaerae]RZS44540.1 beta-lactamase class A [Herbihabitans rhizosphaerae]
MNRLTRRAFLGAAALVPLAGCTGGDTPVPSPSSAPPQGATPRPPIERHDRLAELEQRFGARVGVFAVATGTGNTVAHRADERFAFCSTFKALATAAVLHRDPMSHLETVVRYTPADLMKSSQITRQHVSTGMTIRQVCDAAVRYSDGTAGNLLFRELGGPARLTEFLRSIGDTVTRMDRIEPALTEATPGDPRDTSTPRALGTSYQRLVLGDTLPPDKRAFLRDLMERNTTGAQRIRAGVPQGWVVADKTGTGDYGTVNDIALVWPPNTPPLLIAIMSSKPARDATYDQALIAEAARYAVASLT